VGSGKARHHTASLSCRLTPQLHSQGPLPCLLRRTAGPTLTPAATAQMMELPDGTKLPPLADGEYDVVVLGTGLKECIISGSAPAARGLPRHAPASAPPAGGFPQHCVLTSRGQGS
jgi:hypothetical protein